jgi:hypothetical protein
MGALQFILYLGCMLKFCCRNIVALNPDIFCWIIIVYLSPYAMSGTLPCLMFVPLLGAPVLPKWWLRKSMYLKWKQFPSITLYNHYYWLSQSTYAF